MGYSWFRIVFVLFTLTVAEHSQLDRIRIRGKWFVDNKDRVVLLRALKSFDKEDLAKFLQFVTGTSKVPLAGFSKLEGMNGPQKFQIHRDDRDTSRLPCAHTCFNQLDLPAYENYEKLRTMLLMAIRECSTGFGLA